MSVEFFTVDVISELTSESCDHGRDNLGFSAVHVTLNMIAETIMLAVQGESKQSAQSFLVRLSEALKVNRFSTYDAFLDFLDSGCLLLDEKRICESFPDRQVWALFGGGSRRVLHRIFRFIEAFVPLMFSNYYWHESAFIDERNMELHMKAVASDCLRDGVFVNPVTDVSDVFLTLRKRIQQTALANEELGELKLCELDHDQPVGISTDKLN